MKSYSDLKDEQLIELIRTKDKELYSEIIKRYENKLLRYANYLMKDEHIAADIVQESFIKAYVSLNGFDTKKKFSSWIYRIVHNEAMNAIKKEKRKINLDSDQDLNSGVDLEEDVIKKELRINTRKCLEEIPVKYSEPLALFFLEDKTYEEISDILRLPVGTVGTRINRAKKLMQKICKK